MSRSLVKCICLAAIAFFAVSCAHMPLPQVVLKPSKAETELVELTKKQEAKNAELKKQWDSAELIFKTRFESNLSLGAASVMSGLDTLLADPTKDKYNLAATMALQVAVATLPQPTLADYKKTTETQRKLLSEQAAELESGKKEIEAQKAEALASKEAQRVALAEKARIENEKVASEITFNAEKDRLSKEAIKQTNEAAALRAAQDAEKVKNAESRKSLEKWVVTILMIVGVIAGIIAFVIKGPMQMFNPGAAIASAACIGLAIGVSFLPLGYLIGAVATVFALIITVVIIEWKKADDAADHLAGAQAEYLDKNPNSSLAAHVEEWTGGKDSKVAKFIEDKQKQLNVK